jgi:hypothetical protein
MMEHDMEWDTIVDEKNGITQIEKGAVSISVRSYFSTYHLWSARNFATMVKEIEDNFSGRQQFDIRHRSYSISAILSAVAFIEAAINEVFQDAADNNSGCMRFPSTEVQKGLSIIWQHTEEKNKTPFSILDKYQLALSLSSNKEFETDNNPYQDISLVIKLRNMLVHFKPDSISAEEAHKFEKKVRGRFPENKLMEGAMNPYYPDRMLGYGCAIWGVESALNLADEFFSRLGVIPNYQQAKF